VSEMGRERAMERVVAQAGLVLRAEASFRESLPYQPREAVWDLYREKLAGPLSGLRDAVEAAADH
jgi:hypothetical protein